MRPEAQVRSRSPSVSRDKTARVCALVKDAELADHGERMVDRDGRASKASEPGRNQLLKREGTLRGGMRDDVAIEMPQRHLRAAVWISESPFEGEEPLELSRQATPKPRLHRGTGSASLRRRFVARRTYADVELGLAWPRMSPTTLGSAPSSIWRVAWLWRNT